MAKIKRNYSIDENGKRKPSVTEIIGKNLGWKAPALYGYFYKRGKEGLPMNAHRDSTAARGSCTHDLVAAHFAPDEHSDLSEWSEAQIDEARPNADRVIAEVIKRNWQILAVELAMESQSFAGTVDLVVRNTDGSVMIVDLKTSTNAYGETAIQCGSYSMLWRQHCVRTDRPHTDFALSGAVLHAPFGSDLSVLPITPAALVAGEQAFRLLLQLHEIEHQIVLGEAA